MTLSKQGGSRSYAVALAAVLLAVLLVACGDDDDGSASSGDTGSGASSSSSSSAPEDGAADDSDAESPDDDSASDDSGDTASSSVLAEGCDALIFIFVRREADNEVPFKQALDALRAMGEVQSPIQADLQLVSEAYEPFFDELAAAGVDNLAEYNDLDEETRSRVDSTVADLETPQVMAATNNITDYIDQEC
jgi:hypothetical protein